MRSTQEKGVRNQKCEAPDGPNRREKGSGTKSANHPTGRSGEKGVRNQKCEAPDGPFRLLVPDPFFSHHVEAIVFDAVGTLIYPEPAAAEVYAVYGQRFGYCCPVSQILTRFQQALRQACWQPATDERHREVWRSIVEAVFDDSSTRLNSLFEALWQHFAQSSSWRLFADVVPALDLLSQRGWQLAIASNFDRRLQPLCRGIEETAVMHGRFLCDRAACRQTRCCFF